MATIAAQFRHFIDENFLFGRSSADLSDQDSLLDNGVIDSTGVLELIGFVETNFGVRVEDTDVVPENLDSIDNLVRFIESRRQCQCPMARAIPNAAAAANPPVSAV